MNTKLSDDQREALRNAPNGPITVQDDQTQREYVLVDQAWHARAMLALKQHEDVAAIAEGIRDMERGDVAPFDDVAARIRAKLGLAPSP